MSSRPLSIVGLCGSLRQRSFNRMALGLAAASLPQGTCFSVAPIGDFPLFDADLFDSGIPAAVSRVAEQLRGADGVVIATPEYNFSIPGVLKNALDWLSRGQDQPWRNKPVAILSASPGPLGGARVQYDLRKVLLFVEASVLVKPEVFIGNATSKFTERGDCSDMPTVNHVGGQMSAFVEWIHSSPRETRPAPIGR